MPSLRVKSLSKQMTEIGKIAQEGLPNSLIHSWIVKMPLVLRDKGKKKNKMIEKCSYCGGWEIYEWCRKRSVCVIQFGSLIIVLREKIWILLILSCFLGSEYSNQSFNMICYVDLPKNYHRMIVKIWIRWTKSTNTILAW